MKSETVQIGEVWRTLLKTRRELPQLVSRQSGPRINFWSADRTGRSAVDRRVSTGAGVAQAEKLLSAAGWDVDDARETLRMVVLSRFSSFARGWSAYCNNDGWLRDLLLLDEELRAEIVKHHDIAGLVETADALRTAESAMPDVSMIIELAQTQTRLLKSLRDGGDHPAVDILEHKYGLDRSLAKAVMLYGQTVPWWAYVVLNVFILISGWIFWLALTDPQNAAFTNDSVGGVGPLHYILLPLFCIGMAAAEVWLIIDTPRREKAWREQLTAYRESLEKS